MLFEPSELLIFKYELGESGSKYADPLRIKRRLSQSTNGTINDLVQAAAGPDEQARFAAEDKLVAAVCFAFNLPAIDANTGIGCTDEFLLGLLNKFLDWESKKKQSTET